MRAMPFIKMHGCGNDYVYLDCLENAAPDDPGHIAAVISDRHRSIGSDGLVLMLPGDLPGVAARMRMFNADGSEGALCGNALRCMAMWLHQTGRCGTHFRIAMADRLIDASILDSDGSRKRAHVRVLIGEPLRLNPAAAGRESFLREVVLHDVDVPRLVIPMLQVAMGNSHTVLFVNQLDEADFSRLGPLIENHPAFPNRTNVEFVEVTGPSSARVRVWERGSGETLACGSGACAVAVAGIARGLFDQSAAVAIHMEGGPLQVVWDDDHQLHLEGSAEEAFSGVVLVP